jgi:hypothetical protein
VHSASAGCTEYKYTSQYRRLWRLLENSLNVIARSVFCDAAISKLFFETEIAEFIPNVKNEIASPSARNDKKTFSVTC